ncbi:TetR family transcriptional regulator [Streptomyces narbonensis]
MEAQLDHAFAIVRDTFGSGIGAGRPAPSQQAEQAPAARASTTGDVVVAVARTDAPLDEVMRTIQQALKNP